MASFNTSKQRILCVFGTRPEAIKMAPVIKKLNESDLFETKICLTGQHREMLDQVMNIFSLSADFDLDVMKDNQTLTELTTKILIGMEKILRQWRPDWVLVQGDTTTVFAASLAAFYQKINVAHIEAGLRTKKRYSPFPEEINRCLASQLMSIHFAPTEQARQNLLKEDINNEAIFVTGNTVIDALFSSLAYLDGNPTLTARMEQQFHFLNEDKHLILVTGHRRENHGDGFSNICRGLCDLARREDVQIIYPVHLNPNVQKPVHEQLGDVPNIHLIEPLDYLSFLFLLRKCHLVLTDSGGVQEEAPSLGKPVLVMRETTERPEAVTAGTALLIGAVQKNIVRTIEQLLDDPTRYNSMSKAHNPYGDGKAAERILDAFNLLSDHNT